MRHLVLLVLVLGCGSKKARRDAAPPPVVAADAALDAPSIDAPEPLVHPSNIKACNLDGDCGTLYSCDCQRCITSNKTVHVELCPKQCKVDPCVGKIPVCKAGICTIE